MSTLLDREELWSAPYDGPPSGSGDPVEVAPDNSGGVFVAGTSRGSPSEADIATVRYDSSGAELWVVREARGNPIAPRGEDIAHDIAVDGSGNVYVVGRTYATGGGDDMMVVNYAADGTDIWYSVPGAVGPCS